MPDRKMVIKGLKCIVDGDVRCESCGYAIDKHGHHSCQQNCASDAISLLKEQDGQIRIKTENFNRLVAKIGVMPKIVRCKDCRYGEPVKNGAGDDCIQCNNDDLWLDGSLNFPDWFCADGERR